MWRTAAKRFVRHVCFRNAFPLFFFTKTFNSIGDQRARELVRVNYWVGSHNPARTSSGSMYELWISDGFEWFFTVNILYHKLCPRSIQATHTHACHSEVSIRFLGRPAFQLPMFRKCDLLPKRDLSDMFVLGMHSRYSFLQRHSTHADIRESGRVNYWVGSHNPARTSSGSMYELWISEGFEWSFALNFLYPNLLSSVDPSNSCLSQWSFD